MAGEETDGSEGATGRDDAAELEEALDGEDEEDEEGNEVLSFATHERDSPKLLGFLWIVLQTRPACRFLVR